MANVNFIEDIRIDADALEKEWVEQPKKYLKYSDMFANATMELNKMKDSMAIKIAQLDKEVRKKLSLGASRVTEAMVMNAVNEHPERINLANELFEKEKQLNLIKGAVNAFEHRKKALEKLVELWISGYYSAPRESRNVKDKVVDSVSNKIKNKLNN